MYIVTVIKNDVLRRYGYSNPKQAIKRMNDFKANGAYMVFITPLEELMESWCTQPVLIVGANE